MFRFPIYPNLTFLNSSRLQPVLIYHQFAGADATTFANVMKIPVFTIGGQHGVIAEDRFPNRAGAQEGTPCSKKLHSRFFLLGFYGLAGGPLLVSLQPSLSPGGMPAFVASNKSKHACWRRKRQITKRLFLKGYNKVLIYHQFVSAAAKAERLSP